jgi:hypothetical protein
MIPALFLISPLSSVNRGDSVFALKSTLELASKEKPRRAKELQFTLKARRSDLQVSGQFGHEPPVLGLKEGCGEQALP